MELYRVTNPTNSKFEFAYNSAVYELSAGETREFPPEIARHAAKKLADREVRKNKESGEITSIRHEKLMMKYLDTMPGLIEGFHSDTSAISEEMEEALKPLEEPPVIAMSNTELNKSLMAKGLGVPKGHNAKVSLLIEKDLEKMEKIEAEKRNEKK